ncbi:MAG: amidohydrolase [Clostridiales bacterium]|nr:amidohydrolase [Clostridiales bacterium]
MLEEQYLKRATEKEEKLILLRRKFHQIPEIGGEEEKTRTLIVNTLEDLGVQYQTYPTHYGVTAFVQGKHRNKITALRADMDGLPVTESNRLSYGSMHPGKMHACGHDAHMAIALGAVELLQENRKRLNGSVKVFFEPAEETVGGARWMVQEGCMENPEVTSIIGLHMNPDYETGTVIAKSGAMSGASDDVEITIVGKGAHGAYPEKGTDAIVIAAQIVTALQTLVSRKISPLDSAVLSLGKVKGGTAGNIICDQVYLEGTLRTLQNTTREELKKTISSLVKGIAESMGAKAEVTLKSGYAPIVNDQTLYLHCKDTAEKIVGKEKLVTKEFPSLGVESFGFFLEKTKGFYYDLGCGVGAGLHSEHFKIDEKVLKTGVALQAAMATRILQEG